MKLQMVHCTAKFIFVKWNKVQFRWKVIKNFKPNLFWVKITQLLCCLCMDDDRYWSPIEARNPYLQCYHLWFLVCQSITQKLVSLKGSVRSLLECCPPSLKSHAHNPLTIFTLSCTAYRYLPAKNKTKENIQFTINQGDLLWNWRRGDIYGTPILYKFDRKQY